MEKLKNRLDAFSDAIIAIIITIMVLNLHTVLSNSPSAYLALGKEIGIYFISFFYVANMWYQHATAFNEIKTMSYRILILDFVFLAALSLMPLFTDMMGANTNRVTVMAYGVLSLLVGVFFRYLAKAIVHLQYTNTDDMSQLYSKIYGKNNQILSGINIATVVLAYFQPTWAIGFFLAYPLWNFLSNSDYRQEMYDVEQLTPEQREEFLKFDTKDRKAFREQQKKISQLALENTATAAPVTEITDTKSPATSETPITPVEQPKAPAKNSRPQPKRPRPRRSNVWQQWLDQNVDPAVQQQIMQGRKRLTEEQKNEWNAWFREHRRELRQDSQKQQHHNHHNQ